MAFPALVTQVRVAESAPGGVGVAFPPVAVSVWACVSFRPGQQTLASENATPANGVSRSFSPGDQKRFQFLSERVYGTKSRVSNNRRKNIII